MTPRTPVPTWLLALALVASALVAALGFAAASTTQPTPQPAAATEEGPSATYENRVVVGYAGDPGSALDRVREQAREAGGSLLRTDPVLDFSVAQVPADSVPGFLEEAREDPEVRYAHRDVRASIQAGVLADGGTSALASSETFVPDDPLYEYQWGPEAIGLELAWTSTLGSHDRTVSVLDTGVDYTHEDLTPNVCELGYDFYNDDEDPFDDHGHGTHVAGTVAAAIDNGTGVAGTGDSCVRAVKVLSSDGFGSFADVASAIRSATDNGTDVISMSLGGCPGCDPGPPTTDAVEYAHDRGVLIVAAAGNSGCDSEISYPAGYEDVMAIASVNPPDGTERSWFSSCGPGMDVAAPGHEVISTVPPQGPLSDPSGYMNLSGTSMATPHVSGTAALVWSQAADLGNDELRCVLDQTADDLDRQGHDVGTGFGLVNASTALEAGGCTPEPPSKPHVTVRSGDRVVELDWAKPFSFGSNITEYRIYRGTTADSTMLHAEVDNRTYRDTNVTNNETYYYEVSAVNAEGEGPTSDLAGARPRVRECQLPGPDGFGYTCQGRSFTFEDVSENGTELHLRDDDVSEPIPLPFTFLFYGDEKTSIQVSDNGFVGFNLDDAGCCRGQPIPDSEPPNGLIAGLWSDLDPSQGGTIHYDTRELLGETAVVVQFTEVPYNYGDEGATFQIVLFQDGASEVRLLDVHEPSFGAYTTGMEDAAGLEGVRFAWSGEGLVDTAVRLDPPAFPDLEVRNVETDPDQPLHGERVGFSTQIHNAGNGSADEVAVEFLVDGDSLGTVLVDGLGPGNTTTVDSPVWEASEGEHNLTVRAEPRGNLPDDDPSDNELTRTFTVRSTLPDLAVDPANVTVEQRELRTPWTPAVHNPWAGKDVTVTLSNRGNATTSVPAEVNVTACTRLDGGRQLEGPRQCDVVGLLDVPRLGPGESATVQAQWDTKWTVGDVDVCATIQLGQRQAHTANDRACQDTFVVAGGTGFGGLMSPAP